MNDDEYIPRAVRLGLIKNFVPLPSDPNIPLTKEQMDALFPPENRAAFIKKLMELDGNKTEEEES